MSDYYEVQAAESRPGAVSLSTSCCLSETIEATKASTRAPSLSPPSLPPRRLSLAKRPTPERREEEEKTTDRANNAGGLARQVQRTVACVGRGLNVRESSPQVPKAGNGLFVFPRFI